MGNSKAKIFITFSILFTFLWSQTIWAYGFEIYEPQKNLANNLQEKSAKDFSRTNLKASLNTFWEHLNNQVKNLTFSSVIKPTQGLLKGAFYAILVPQNLPQNWMLQVQNDSFGDMTYKQAKNAKGEITHLETHNFTRDGNGRISGDTYHKETINYNQPSVIAGGAKQSRQTRDRVIEDGKISYNKYGQVTSADITRQVKTEMSVIASETKQSRGWKEIANYTMEIKLTTTQDSLGRVVSESESTHIFGKEGVQQKNGSWKSKDVDYTINRDRTYSYNGNSVLPSGWHEKVTQSNMDLVIETDVWDIKYDDKGRMEDYRGKTHEYGSYIDAKGKTQALDVTREFHRYDIAYNEDNRISSYREDRWSSDKPGLIQYAYVHDITYNSAGFMESYMEQLREVGYVSIEGAVTTGIPPPTNLEQARSVLNGLTSKPDSVKGLTSLVLIDRTTVTHRTGIQYNGLNQITGYTDTITRPDGKQEISTMTNITYWADGRMKGYSQTTTGPDDEGKIKTHTTNIYTTEYDRLGRIDEKYGTYDGKAYKWQAISYDDLGRPTAYKEKYGKVSSKHYDIVYNELGDVSYEKIKVSAKSGWGPFSSKSKVLTEYWYGYDEYGQHEKIKENEIYRKVSSNPIGTIIKAIVSIVIIAATWGAATPYVAAAWMAASNFVFALLSGASLKDALIGAAISFAAAVIGAQLGAAFGGGASAATQTATSFLKDGGMTLFFQALSLADSLMVDDQGRGLFEQLFGEWGSIVFDVISVLVALKSGTGNKGPPYQLYAALGRLAVSAILTALGDRIDPRLRQFISAFTTSFLNAWANAKTAAYNEEQKAKFEKSMKDQGFEKLSNGKYVKWSEDGTILTTIDPKTGMSYTDVFNENGYSHSEALIKTADGQTLTAVTDMFGNIQGILPSGATPQFDSNGNFIGSTNESVFGTRYYGTDGQEQAWIPEGYTPTQNEFGEITGSYKNFDYGVTEYRDNDGKFQYWTRQGKDGEIYIHDGNTVTNLRVDGTTDWTKQNIPFSTINYYDAAGQKITAQLMTKLDENGFIQNKIYHDLATDEYTFYDRDGNNLGTYQARRDREGNIYAYKTTDANGNQIIVDKNLNIRSSLAPDGTYTVHRRDDPSQIYYVLRPDSISIIGKGDNIRFVLDLDPDTNKYALYDGIGNKITDNPALIVAKLNFSLLTLPASIRDKLWSNAKDFLQAITDYVFKQPQYTTDGAPLIKIGFQGELSNIGKLLNILKYSKDGETLYLNIPEHFDYEQFVNNNLNELLAKNGLTVGKAKLIGDNIVQIKIARAYELVPEFGGRSGINEKLMARETIFADTKNNTANLGLTIKDHKQLAEITQMIAKDKDAWKGHLQNTIAMNAYKDGTVYRGEYYKLLDIRRSIESDIQSSTGLSESSKTEFGNSTPFSIPALVNLKWEILNLIVNGPNSEELKNKYLPQLLGMNSKALLGELKGLDPKKPIWFIASGWNTTIAEALSLGGLNSRVTERLGMEGINDNKIWFLSNLEGLAGLDFIGPEQRAHEAAFALAGFLIQAHEMYPDQPIFIQGHSLFNQTLGEALIILEKLGYTWQNNNRIVAAVFPFEPAVDNEVFSEGGKYYNALENTVVAQGIATYTSKDWAGVAYRIRGLFTDKGFLNAGPQVGPAFTEKLRDYSVTPLIKEPWYSTTGHSILYESPFIQVKPYWDFVLYQYNNAIDEFNRSRNK